MVVYANRITRSEQDANGDEVERQIPFLKAYTVFCRDQIEGLPAHINPPVAPALAEHDRIGHAEIDAIGFFHYRRRACSEPGEHDEGERGKEKSCHHARLIWPSCFDKLSMKDFPHPEPVEG